MDQLNLRPDGQNVLKLGMADAKVFVTYCETSVHDSPNRANIVQFTVRHFKGHVVISCTVGCILPYTCQNYNHGVDRERV